MLLIVTKFIKLLWDKKNIINFINFQQILLNLTFLKYSNNCYTLLFIRELRFSSGRKNPIWPKQAFSFEFWNLIFRWFLMFRWFLSTTRFNCPVYRISFRNFNNSYFKYFLYCIDWKLKCLNLFFFTFHFSFIEIDNFYHLNFNLISGYHLDKCLGNTNNCILHCFKERVCSFSKICIWIWR